MTHSSPQFGFTPWPEDFQKHYRELGYWRDLPLQQALEKNAELIGHHIAVADDHKQRTYAELNDRANQLASGLLQYGLQPGDSVVLQLPNMTEFYEWFYACLKAAIRPVLALPAARELELSAFCDCVNAAAYIGANTVHHRDYLRLARHLHHAGKVTHVFMVGDAEEFVSDEQLRSVPAAPLPVINASHIAFFQLSGGTTGLPKLIPRTHNDYDYSVRRSAVICALRHDSRYLCALPAAHNFPLSSPGALGVFWAGGRVVLTTDSSPHSCFQLIEKHGITLTALVPPLVISWLNASAQLEHRLSTLKLIQVGGAKLSTEIARRIEPVLGCRLQQVFGMAEGLVNYTRIEDDSENIIHTQGRPMSDADEVRVVDDEDQDLPIGEVGHLLTRGPYTIRGYFNAPQHNERSFTADGFYRTGDLVQVNAAGYVSVQGRAKDQINRGGEKIAAEEVENQLLAHANIVNAAVVSVADEYLGEKSCAFCIADTSLRPIVLKQFLQSRGLAAYKIPDYIMFIEQMPKTPVGKIDKKRLQHLAETSIKTSQQSLASVAVSNQ